MMHKKLLTHPFHYEGDVAPPVTPPASATPPAPEVKTFTQAQLDSMFADRATQAERQTLKALGFDSQDAANQFLKDARALLDKDKKQRAAEQSELEKLAQEKSELQTKFDTLQSELTKIKGASSLRSAAQRAKLEFVSEEALQDAIAHVEADKLKDDAGWDTAVKTLSTARNYLFKALQVPPPTNGSAQSNAPTSEKVLAEQRAKAQADVRYARA